MGTANEELPIDTIAYFGQRDLIEPFIAPLMSGSPKVIIEYALGQQSYQFELNFNNKIFFLAFGNFEPSINWQYLYDVLSSMQSHVRGIFIAATKKGLTEHFDWCWRKGFLNVLALVPHNNHSQPFKLYTYRRFPMLKVFELPVNESTSYFQNKLNNLRGYKVRTGVQYDPPRVFPVPHPTNPNETIYRGYAARTYTEFLKYHNAGMEIIEHDKSSTYNILTVIEQLKQGVADLSMNPYLPYPGTRISYPVNMMRWCILVPARGEIAGYIYFLRPFQLEVWLMCIGMLFYLSFIKSLNQFIDSKFHFFGYHRRIDIGRGLIETLRLMLYMPAPTMYQNFRWHYAWNYGVVAIFGFMLSNLYLALETSFLSKIIFERQVDTLAEMVAQNITINAIEHEVPIILRNLGLPKGFADLLVPRNSTEMIADVLALRVGRMAYVARQDMIDFVLSQQRNQIHPKFHLAEECITTIPVGFLMPSHSQFQIELDIFTLQAASAGLTFRWYGLTIIEAFRAGILRYQAQKFEVVTALSLEHFHFAFLILMYGLVFSSIVLLFEQLSRFRIRIWLKRRD